MVQKQLQKVSIQTFGNLECSSRYQFAMHNTTLCAGVPEGGKGQCSGDSGGPLLVNGEQVGIVSWSRKPCTQAPYPGVFTKVSDYVNWILKTIWQASESANDGNSSEEIMSGELIIATRHNPLANGNQQDNRINRF